MSSVYEVLGQMVGRNPAKSLFAWFLALILAGTFLLLLPVCRAPDAEPVSLSDAAFTATSASCVTGLVVRSTPNDFSFWGQLVILVLIQCGGLGILTVATLFFIDLTGGSTSAQHEIAQQTLGAGANDDLRIFLRRVVGFTLSVELLAAVILTANRWPGDSPGAAIWWGVFHSVSAFCNGGFALQDDSLSSSVADPVVNLTIIMLILIGGIGYPVIRDIAQFPWRRRGRLWSDLSFHTKLTLVSTIILVFGGALLFWAVERNNALSDSSPVGAICASLFQSTTTRTAGFNTLPLAELTNATLFGMILFMVVGANSCSTGGGMKVSTMAILFLDMAARLRGKSEVRAFGQRVTEPLVVRCLMVLLFYLLMATVGLELIVCLEEGRLPHSQSGGVFLDSLFEVISALATVGLSTGFTGQMSEPSRWVVVALMFAGRVGPLTVVTVISRPPKTEEASKLPVAEPIIG